MSDQIRSGLRAGVTFGVILLFLALIGFAGTAADLIASLAGERTGTPASLMAYVALLGLWAGARAARPADHDRWGAALTGGLLAGIGSGLLMAAYALIFGALDASGVDLRENLAAMAPNYVRLTLFRQGGMVAALLYLGTLVISGLAGAALARALRSGGWSGRLLAWWRERVSAFRRTPLIQKVRANRYSIYVIYALLLVFFFILPSFLNKFWNYNLGTVGIYVLLGLGLNIVVGMAGLLDLGYVAFFAIGAYTVALLTAPAPHDLQWSFWIALPIGVLLAAIAGIILGIPVLRMRGDYLAIVTLGFGEIIRILSKSDALTGFAGGPRGVRNIGGPMLFGMPFNGERQFMYLIILGCLLVLFVTSRLQNSRVGRAWVAMREDETVAQAMGINTWQYKLMAFAIGAAFAGLGGVLFASRNQFTGPEDHNLMVSINVLSLVIVGGMGSIPGVFTGALVLKGLPEILRQLDVYRMLAFGALLVAMMLLRPEGLWPSQRRRLEIHEAEQEIPGEEELQTEPSPQAAGGTSR